MANRLKEAKQEEIPQQREHENDTDTAQTEQKTSSPKRKGGLAKSLTAVFGGGFLGTTSIIKQLPFIFFLTFIALFYIANGYWADDKIRQLNSLTNELKELRSEQVSVKSELEYVSNEVQIAESAKKIGLEYSRNPPMKILVRDTTTAKILSTGN
jgi:hypothetical protein